MEMTPLNGVALSEATLADGTKQYTSISGDTKGLKLTVNGSISSATVFYGQSLADKLSDYIENVISATGDLEKSKKSTTSISDFNQDQADLEEGLKQLEKDTQFNFQRWSLPSLGSIKQENF